MRDLWECNGTQYPVNRWIVAGCYERARLDWVTSREVGEVTRSLASAYVLRPSRLYKVLLISGRDVRGRGTRSLLTDGWGRRTTGELDCKYGAKTKESDSKLIF